METIQEKAKLLLTSKFPEFKRSESFVEKLLECGQMVTVPKGTLILDIQEYIKVIPLLLNGLIKIYREDEYGNEILLYYINSGESCVISITTCLKNEKSSIKALIEEESELLTVPSVDFITLLGEYNLLHNFTYDLFNLKYNELIKSIDSLAFTDTKTRLLSYLKREANNRSANVITGMTHKDIAKDLSTSREVISRLLYALNKEGVITLKNKEIIIR